MDIQRIRFLREIMLTHGKDKPTLAIEFSYDDGFHREPHFFGVPTDELTQARQLYSTWGGRRPEGYGRGTTVRKP